MVVARRRGLEAKVTRGTIRKRGSTQVSISSEVRASHNRDLKKVVDVGFSSEMDRQSRDEIAVPSMYEIPPIYLTVTLT